MKGRFSGRLAFPFRLTVTGALLAYVVHAFKLDTVVKSLQAIGVVRCSAVVALFFALFMVLSYRWYRILHASGVDAGLAWTVRVVFIGLFFNQCLPTSFGGDGVRVLMLRSAATPLETAVNAVLVDRLSGLAGLVPLLVCGTPFLFEWAIDPTVRIASLSLTLLLSAVLALYFFADRLIRLAGTLGTVRLISRIAKASSFARAIVWYSRGAAMTAVLAVCAHFMMVTAVVVLASASGAQLPLPTALVLVPPVIAAAALPISLGGWGTREFAMIASLGAAGVPPATGLATSIMLGFLLFLATLPGVVLWLIGKRLSSPPAISSPPRDTRQPAHRVEHLKSLPHPPR